MAEPVRYQIVESESRTFTFRAHLPSQAIPPIGSLVQVHTFEGHTIFGVVYRALVLRDEVLEQLGALTLEEFSQYFGDLSQFGVPVEVSVASVGYRQQGDSAALQVLPARPPVFLDRVTVCSQDEVVQFTRSLAYLHLLLNAVNDDELVATHLRLVAQAHKDEGKVSLSDLARELARRLIYEPWRADRILSYLVEQQ